MRPLELTGRKFNYLKVIRLSSVNRNKNRYWECICNCGVQCIMSTDHLTRKKNPVVSCGCKQISRGTDHVQWKGYGEISQSWWRIHVLREYSKSFARRKVEVTVTIKQGWKLFLKQNRKCSLSGIELRFSLKGILNTASLDRIDSSKGYTLKNVQWVHKHINFMKRDFTQQYFIDMCSFVTEKNK